MSRDTLSGQRVLDLLQSSEFKLLAKGFNRFCPFEACGMVRAEIRHGHFLSYMLDTRKPHGLGDRVVGAFLRVALGQTAEAVLPYLESNRSSIEVRREWKRVDLLVVLPSSQLVIAVELKIDAFQSEHQLANYRATVEREFPAREGWQHKFLFLTKRGEVSNDGWDDLPIVSLVAGLENCISDDETGPGAGMLRDYVKMMRAHHVGDDLTVDLAKKLWSEHGEVLDFIARNRPMPIRDLFDTLKATASVLAEGACSPTMSIVEDVHATSIIRFAVKEWDTIKDFRNASSWTASKRLILLELKPHAAGIDAFCYIAPSKDTARRRLASKLAKAGLVPQSAAEGDGWGLLTKAELFRTTDILGFEQETAYGAVSHAFNQFAARVFESFDPVLRS